MEIKKELLDNQIAQMKVRLDNATASVNQITGAIVVLEDLRKYLDIEEDKPEEPRKDISEENEKIQNALSEKQLAEMVGGAGAVVESIEEIQPEEYYPDHYYGA